ncbi:MAG: hypothetical protein IT165_21520 [Bryobacterales bacterium]|nr:hypothetical protein [Bryobacterales bacterium]
MTIVDYPRLAVSGSSRKIVLLLFISLAGLAGTDSLLFRTDLYLSLINPDSSTATLERILKLELSHKPDPAQQRILILGDSRMGFLARVANEGRAGNNYYFVSAAIGGTTPRCWFYLLRDMDPRARAYKAIVIPLEDYEDEDTAEDLADRKTDLNYLIARLGWADVVDFPASFHAWNARWYSLRSVVLRGFLLKRDLQEFLANPRKRLDAIEVYKGWQQWVYDYRGETRSLEGLRVNWKAGTIMFPPGVPENIRQFARARLLRKPAPQTGQCEEYRRLWLGRIVECYAGSNTRVVFLRLPRGPVVRPVEWNRSTGSVVRELARRREVILAPEHAFDMLEQPKYFMDPMHLNGEGMRLLSRLVAELVLRLLGS